MDSVIKNLLHKWVSRLIDETSLTKRLQSGKKLRIKLGVDPTAPIIHLGHAVPILKLREFQKLGHQVIILIGDATAQVGDSSDKDAERPMLTRNQTQENAAKYLAQFGKILDLEKVEVYYNSTWLDKINFCGVGELAKHFSVAEMLDRDNFSKRYKAGIRISLQEFLYPLMQGYDSVALKCDIELGGNDQYFNLLAGRRLQEAYGQEKQDIMMFHLIMWTDGKKMSKTTGNYISLDMSANEMFSKIMEIPDDQIISYFESCSIETLEEIAKHEEDLKNGTHPREIKKKLAQSITKLYHSEENVYNAEVFFEQTIAGGVRPKESDIPLHELRTPSIPLITLIREIGMVGNSTEARNAVTQWWVKVNEAVILDPKYCLTPQTEKILIQVGRKKYAYIQLT